MQYEVCLEKAGRAVKSVTVSCNVMRGEEAEAVRRAARKPLTETSCSQPVKKHRKPWALSLAKACRKLKMITVSKMKKK